MSYRDDRGPPRERPRGGTTLYVTGFGPGTRARDLAQVFEDCGRLVRCDIPAPRTSTSRPFAFVEYEDAIDARAAFDDLHGKTMGYDRLKLEWARTPPSANWRFDGGEAPRGGPPPRDRRERSPRRDRGGYRDRSRSPVRDRGRNGYSPARRDRDYDRRDRDDRRERDYDRPARSPRGDDYRDRDMKDRDADTREPDNRTNGDDTKEPIDQAPAVSGHDDLDTAE